MAQRYDTYKDSGVQWLGKIPGHWGCARLNKLASLKTGTTPKFFENELEGDTIDWYTPSDFTDDFKLSDSQRRLNKVDFDGSGLSYVPSNSVLIIGIGGTAGKVACNKKECYSNQQITSLIPNERMYNLYMMLYFKSIRNILLETAHYTTLPILNNSFLAGVSLPLPPLPEQHAIVSYLDDKCGKIDEWIEKKLKEVELLGEMKQRVIADAVTRGLNPDVKMKPTNIPWLPEVPEHWEIKPIRSLLKESEEKSETGKEELLSLSQYTGITYKKDAGKTGMFEAESTIGYKIVLVGQFVMNIMLAWNGSYAVSNLEGIISPAYCVFNFICDCDKLYYDYLLRTKAYSSAFKTESKGIIESRLRLYPNKFYPFHIPVPPLSEQHAIVSYITERTAKIDRMVENINNEIENLKEYKQRLISDVVTGQIKVC